jgi:hypothetical protein
MAKSIIVHALTKKRAEVSGQIVALEDRIRQLAFTIVLAISTILL